MVKIKNPFKKKIGLVLGGGGARGFIHVGVLKVLEENGIVPDMIAGTSMGALVGAVYALEPNSKKLEKISLNTDMKKKLDLQFPKTGLIKGNRIENYLRELYNNKKFSDTKIPLFIVATDLLNKNEIIFSEGDITKAVRASISIPGVFNPVVNNKKILVDGGVLNNLPANILRKKGADIIICVNPVEVSKKEIIFEKAVKEEENLKIPNILKTIELSLQLMQSRSKDIEFVKKHSDIFIQAHMPEINIYDFQKRRQIIKIGEKETRKYLKKIKRLKRFRVKHIFKKIIEKDKNSI